VVLEEGAGLLVLGDVRVDQEDAALLGAGVALGDIGVAGAQRLHLGAGELDAGLQGVLDVVVEARAPALGDALAAVVALGSHGTVLWSKGRNQSRREWRIASCEWLSTIRHRPFGIRPNLPTRRPSPAAGPPAPAPRRPSAWSPRIRGPAAAGPLASR